MTTVKDIIAELELWAPSVWQESYDNGGLIVGSMEMEVKGVLCCLDCTEDIVQEAINNHCNVVLAHHPIVFSGLKKITGKNYVEQTVIKAIKNDVAIIAWHTALDNVSTGVNAQLGKVLGMRTMRILQPKKDTLLKLAVYVLPRDLQAIESAVFAAGGGAIGNYSECSFYWNGHGAYKPEEGSKPFIGKQGVRELTEEVKVEFIVPDHAQRAVHQAMVNAHPYEEVAHEWIVLDNVRTDVGSGMIGDLPQPVAIMDWLRQLKSSMSLGCIKHTSLVHERISKVAWCGGSGDFLLETAIAQGAQVFITSDFKYHRFFDHQQKIIIVDIGHYETESCVIDLLSDWLTEKFTTFAIHKTRIVTNPVQYF